jgi:hypothetical protein
LKTGNGKSVIGDSSRPKFRGRRTAFSQLQIFNSQFPIFNGRRSQSVAHSLEQFDENSGRSGIGILGSVGARARGVRRPRRTHS